MEKKKLLSILSAVARHKYLIPRYIEKIARERYFMKADDEDIFVISTDNVNDDTEK